MRRSEAHQGVRMIEFLDILGRYEAAAFGQLEAADLLGVDERTFRRWQRRYEEDGESGLLDRRLGKVSGKRVPPDREAEVEALYKTRYAGFTAKHFHEYLARDHGFTLGYTWTKTFLHSKGLLEKAKRRGAHRRKRPRRPLPGMMLHQDASRHVWLAKLPALDLVVTMDAALHAGAHGYVLKTMPLAKITAALEAIAAGEISIPWTVADLFPKLGRSEPKKPVKALAKLTARRADVLRLIRAGRSNRQIASELGLTEGTVKAHANAIFRTLGVTNRSSAAAMDVDQERRCGTRPTVRAFPETNFD